MIVWLAFGAYGRWNPSPSSFPFGPIGDILVFILLVLLGVGVFGSPIK
jgi:hypothetical protein